MPETVEYQLLRPREFAARIEACPLAYVPVGSLEWHGEHMALGNDAIKMHALCCLAARAGGGIVLPPIFQGIPFMVPYGAKYAHKANLPVSPELLKAILKETLDGLERAGFRAAVVATGHTCNEQRALVRQAAADYAGAMRVYGTDDMEWAQDIGFTSDHAAKWETSILTHLRPELVEMSRLPTDMATPCEGVWGDDPRVTASEELGRDAVERIVRDLAGLGRRLLSETK